MQVSLLVMSDRDSRAHGSAAREGGIHRGRVCGSMHCRHECTHTYAHTKLSPKHVSPKHAPADTNPVRIGQPVCWS